MPAKIDYIEARVRLEPNSDDSLFIRVSGSGEVVISPPGRFGEMRVSVEDSLLIAKVVETLARLGLT